MIKMFTTDKKQLGITSPAMAKGKYLKELSRAKRFLEAKTSTAKGVKELAEKYGTDIMRMTGFLDGINDSLKEKNPIEEMTEDTMVSLAFDRERLYRNMVDAKADWLYGLPQWETLLDEERRKELTKQTAKMDENTKVAIRNIRRDANEAAKAAKKAGEMTEDDEAESEEEIQKLTDKYIKESDKVAEEKNKEMIAHEQEMLDMFLEKKAITKEDYDRAVQELETATK